MTKGQAKAYARLLNARAIVLVTKEGVWLADEHDDYGKMRHYTWGELQDTDIFDEVYQMVGKDKKKKTR